MITCSPEPIKICEDNSAHYNKLHNSISKSHSELERQLSEFLDKNSSCIFQIHSYPNFNLLNSKYENIGIILIKPDANDMHEIIFNSLNKNKKIKSFFLKKIIPTQLINFELNYNKRNKIFFTDDVYPANCLVIKYSEIYETAGEKYLLIEKLKEFTGISIVPTSVIDACKQYTFNRNEIVKQHGLR
jgi:hypothetical protein